ncbi:hypothetical protein CDL12_00950 [Handroanthus impetiginosus]|uniref:Uncharacterized protein n=1 Tax=Handroanthus impetiginosus TaxID=429701 RepID=A0A2G9I962_9LAMI|nr:hypothetical protein CDL12_00950 [Handroanthus impetiginosus]
MTPHEERLVLELHSKYGNRWSRIARKLPGRTDNEIKNYWRTLMRKKALERKKATTPPSSSSTSSSNSSSSSTSNSPTTTKFTPVTETKDLHTASGENKTGLDVEESSKAYSLDDIWKDCEFSEESCRTTCQAVASPIWDYCPTDDSLWSIDEEQSKMLMQPMGDLFTYFPFS